jgi:hypothetical protein
MNSFSLDSWNLSTIATQNLFLGEKLTLIEMALLLVIIIYLVISAK